MADWTISSGDYMRPWRSPHGPARLDSGPESTTQSYVVGNVLELDTAVSSSAFRLRKAAVSASTVTSTAIIGVAAEPASSNTDQTRIYWPAVPATEFVARTRGGLIQSTTIGVFYGLFFDSTKNVYGIDLANSQSTSIRAVVTGLIDAAGDSGGYVRFRFGRPNGSTVTFGAAITG